MSSNQTSAVAAASPSSPDHFPYFVKGLKGDEVMSVVDSYNSLHDDRKDGNDHPEQKRKDNYQQLVTSYYDLVTDFYEWGWGDCFHFCPPFKTETFREAIQRHEFYLALRMGLKKDDQVLDVGCGVGGPMRNICRFTSCRVTGVNLNPYQCKRIGAINSREGGVVARNCRVLNTDFMNINTPDASFDHAYQIEATAHAPSKVGVYREILRCLKPGGYFAGYEWVMTNKYNPSDPYHNKIKKGIEEGDGLPDIAHASQIGDALREAGFEVIEIRDVALESEVPWWDPLVPKYTSMANFQFTPVGGWAAGWGLSALETLKLAPKGTLQTRAILLKASENLVLGGQEGIFTPMLFHFARKPLNDRS